MEKQESKTERHNGNKTCGKLSNNTNRKKNDRSAWGPDRK